MNRLALISTPWPLFNQPSVQLGALKAFVRQRMPDIEVDAHHVYLSIAAGLGYDLYGRISERTWLAESPYSVLLYPERFRTVARFWKRRIGRSDWPGKVHLEDLCGKIDDLSQQFLDHVDWSQYLLAGFSICFGQLTSTLYFIRKIKQKVPELRIVVGGAACAGDLGKGLLRAFSEIDYVIRGEGELPLVGLIQALISQDGYEKIKVPGLIARSAPQPEEEVSQVRDVDRLPIPLYDDYFKQLTALGPERAFMPSVPMEISRGCWWRKSSGAFCGSGCAFCNLNLQWHGYRAKTRDRVLHEIDALVNKHHILSIPFMDNLLPYAHLDRLFEHIELLDKDLRMFCEIRANTPHHVLTAMGRAGVREVQVGIEALSTSLLTKLKKGTTAIDNMEIMKNCETPGLPDLAANLIMSFPSSDAADIKETLSVLEFAFPFQPLKGINFWLGYGSTVWHNPAAYGIARVGNHPYYGHLFPGEVLRDLRLMIQGYQGGVREQARLWRPVKEKLEEWKRIYNELHSIWPGSLGNRVCEPIMSYQDAGDFMIIRERLRGNRVMTHRLKGNSRAIYLFCETQRPLAHICTRFSGLGEQKILPFLRMMVDKKLMFNEKDRYLSLAVPVAGPGKKRFGKMPE